VTTRSFALPCSIADRIALGERQVAPGLVSPEAWRRLRGIADPFPPIAQDAGFELRLEHGEPRVDFGLCIRASHPERVRIADAIDRSEAVEHSRGWRRAGAFTRAWATAGSAIHDDVHALWLEFDADGPGSPEPFVVFTLDPERLYSDGAAAPTQVLATVAAGIDCLGEGSDPLVQAAVERCVRGLPRYAQFRHAALRPTQTGDVVRLIVRMPWRRIARTLADLGWPGDPWDLHVTLERLCPDTPVHSVNLDVLASGLGPRVGIEFVHLGAPRENARWKALFDQLEALGACAPERRAAISGWGGEVFGSAVGPGLVSARRDLLVKVIYETGAALRAKAYLFFAPRLTLQSSVRSGSDPRYPRPQPLGRALELR
jgi:hypothetical protein